MKNYLLFAAATAVLGVVANMATAEVKTLQLPVETATLRPGQGVEIASAYCIMCHSVDYISGQPIMPRAFWEAEVLKMQKTYGAPIPDATLPVLVDYLTEAYGKK